MFHSKKEKHLTFLEQDVEIHKTFGNNISRAYYKVQFIDTTHINFCSRKLKCGAWEQGQSCLIRSFPLIVWKLLRFSKPKGILSWQHFENASFYFCYQRKPRLILKVFPDIVLRFTIYQMLLVNFCRSRYFSAKDYGTFFLKLNVHIFIILNVYGTKNFYKINHKVT